MPITLNCACGKVLRIADEHAGKRVKCPACNAVIASKPPEPAFEVVEDEPKQLATAKPAAKPRDDDDEDDGSYGLKSGEKNADTSKKKPNFRKRADDDDDDDEEESRPRKKRRTSRSAGAGGGADARKRLGYIASGGIMIPIGIGLAVWGNNGEGRGATKLLIFGICLAIGGLITLVRGITGNIPDDE